MRRLVLSVLSGLAVLALVLPAAQGARVPRQKFSAHVDACHPGLAEADRYMNVTARLRAFAHSKKVGVRFDLFWRPRGEATFKPYPAPGLGTFHRYSRGIVYAQQVKGLPIRAAYVMHVRAHWYDGRGHVIRRATRTTGPCFQPDLRPDLIVAGVGVSPLRNPGKNRYVVVVRNNGRSPAGPFSVTLAFPDGSTTLSSPIAGLAAGKRAFVAFKGPLCAAGAPTASADADAAVEESDETNDSRLTTCPS